MPEYPAGIRNDAMNNHLAEEGMHPVYPEGDTGVAKSRNIHKVAILAVPAFVPFDISIPYQVFPLVRLGDGCAPYEICFCGPEAAVGSREYSICAAYPYEHALSCDTIMVPGVYDPFGVADEDLFSMLRMAAAKGIRIASICTGACLLAASGVLDGLSATSHWKITQALAQRYPAVQVVPDVLFVDNGQVLTSAGLASGLDLCLHIIRKDYGVSVAERIADFFVMPLEREAGHCQVIRRYPAHEKDRLAELQLWILENLHKELSLEGLAGQVCMSTRTLHRRFREQTGDAPMVWVTKARIRRAQALLESGGMSVEQIAAVTGFGSATALRDGFRRHVGSSPSAWRRAFVRREGSS